MGVFSVTDKVTFIIYTCPLLALLQIQVCKSANVYCSEAVKTVKVVESCPTTQEKWVEAAIKKNCRNNAAQQTCTNANLFLYHCVMNGYGNETLEVCAPRRIISGFCTEFNVAGGVIQVHTAANCTNTFPKCDAPYFSTDAYKYPYCYDVVKKNLNSSTPTQLGLMNSGKMSSRRISIFVATSCLYVIVLFGFIVFFGMRSKRRTDRPKDQTMKDGHPIPIPNQDCEVEDTLKSEETSSQRDSSEPNCEVEDTLKSEETSSQRDSSEPSIEDEKHELQLQSDDYFRPEFESCQKGETLKPKPSGNNRRNNSWGGEQTLTQELADRNWEELRHFDSSRKDISPAVSTDTSGSYHSAQDSAQWNSPDMKSSNAERNEPDVSSYCSRCQSPTLRKNISNISQQDISD